MGTVGSKNAKCASITGLIVTSIILGAIGLALLMTIISLGAGLALLITATILCLIAVLMIIHILVTQGWKAQNGWCKFNIVMSIILFIVLIVLVTGGTVNITNVQPANPEPSNNASTQPASQ